MKPVCADSLCRCSTETASFWQRIMSITAGGPEILLGIQQVRKQSPEGSDGHGHKARQDQLQHPQGSGPPGGFLEPGKQGHGELGVGRLVLVPGIGSSQTTWRQPFSSLVPFPVPFSCSEMPLQEAPTPAQGGHLPPDKAGLPT